MSQAESASRDAGLLSRKPSVSQGQQRRHDRTEPQRADESRARLVAIVESSDVAIFSTTPLDGVIESWNHGAERIYGYSAAEIVGRPMSVLAPPDHAGEIEDIFVRIRRGETVELLQTPRIRKDGASIEVSLTISPIRDASRNVIAAAIIARDVSDQVRLEVERLFAESERQIRHLRALQNIDLAIVGSFDLRVVLNVILDQVTTHLHVDAACVLSANAHDRTLTYAAGRGFRTSTPAKTVVRWDAGYAGQAAAEQRLISIPDLKTAGEFLDAHALAEENFTAYFAAPLVAKGQTNGVLEIFHRSAIDPDPGWIEFLNALAGQAAVAIDSATLFRDLQRANSELKTALEASQEGWSRVLAERDRISRDLHDNILQSLYGVNLALEHAAGLIDQDAAEAKRRLAELQHVHGRIVQEIRGFVYDLHLPGGAHRSLRETIDALAAEVRGYANLSVTCNIQDSLPEFPAEIRAQLLIIVREALSNVVRHAAATAVTIEAEVSHAVLTLRVRDNGRGFNAARAPSAGLGLHSMAKRAEAIGGHVEITASPDSGTAVEVTVPVADGVKGT